jgi:hypothetical protein
MRATFARRGTALPTAKPIALKQEFVDAPAKARQWGAFLSKAQLPAQDLHAVVTLLDALLAAPLQAAIDGNPFNSKWSPSLSCWI